MRLQKIMIIRKKHLWNKKKQDQIVFLLCFLFIKYSLRVIELTVIQVILTVSRIFLCNFVSCIFLGKFFGYLNNQEKIHKLRVW